jgi:hypothetical protein
LGVSKKTREETATVHVNGKAKFPINDKKHAQAALRMEGLAKPPLTPSQKSAIERKAAKFGVHSAKKKGN